MTTPSHNRKWAGFSFGLVNFIVAAVVPSLAVWTLVVLVLKGHGVLAAMGTGVTLLGAAVGWRIKGLME